MKVPLSIGALLVASAAGFYVFSLKAIPSSEGAGVLPLPGQSLVTGTDATALSQEEGVRTAISLPGGDETPLDESTPIPTRETIASRNKLKDLAAHREENLEQRQAGIEIQLRERAIRIANELGLATGAEHKISKVLFEERKRIEALTAEFREGDRTPADRTRMRADLMKIPAWRLEEYEKWFGLETARRIEGYKDEFGEKPPALESPESPTKDLQKSG
ncbi:MAG: hypothetical protein ACI9F9_001531 [Candidatus Paceibacteria bacterium]|jgi:hypothetical protein